jgi:hypothetical protein
VRNDYYRPMEIQCGECNKSFEIKPKRYNYGKKEGQLYFWCSKECKKKHSNKRNKEIVACSCGQDFQRDKNLKKKKKFCSQKCANKYSQTFCDYKKISEGLKRYYTSDSGKEFIKNHAEKLKKYKKCPCCDKKFYGGKKYCSKFCLQKSAGINISETRKNMFARGELEVTGGTTKWLTYKNIRVQGSYEYRACVLLDKLKDLKLIKDWHRSNFRVNYLGVDNKRHSYLVDFEIITKSGRLLYLEIKGYIKDNDLLKWDAMKKQSYKLIVWMDKNLKLIEDKLKL